MHFYFFFPSVLFVLFFVLDYYRFRNSFTLWEELLWAKQFVRHLAIIFFWSYLIGTSHSLCCYLLDYLPFLEKWEQILEQGFMKMCLLRMNSLKVLVRRAWPNTHTNRVVLIGLLAYFLDGLFSFVQRQRVNLWPSYPEIESR